MAQVRIRGCSTDGDSAKENDKGRDNDEDRVWILIYIVTVLRRG